MSQTNRKRKLSEASTSCSSLEDDCSSTNEVMKLARSCTSTTTVEEDSDKCPVCLKTLRWQTLSVTDTCSYHTFCFSCLEEWSKTRNTCPVDRKEYHSILVLDAAGNVTKQVPVKAKALIESASEYEPTPCEVCNSFNNEQSMVICDGCGMGYHLHCLMPSLENRPSGVWLCNDCWYYYNY